MIPLFCVDKSRGGAVAKFVRIVQKVSTFIKHSAKRTVTRKYCTKWLESGFLKIPETSQWLKITLQPVCDFVAKFEAFWCINQGGDIIQTFVESLENM